MPRINSGRNWERASYALERDTKEKIKEISKFEGMSQGALISFLIYKWDAGINPINNLNMLMVDRKKLKIQMDEKDKEIEELTKQIGLFEDWKKQKSQKKLQALVIIKRKIIEKDFEQAERISKTWQKITGIPAVELLSEATQQIKESGI